MSVAKEVSLLTRGIIRCFDIGFSLSALIILMPILLAVMLVLCLSGEGEVFYCQVRIGRGGQEFRLLKFATMLKNSSTIGSCELTLPNDSRVLPVGRFLRKTKLNELAQLWNVLVGDLSLIGPRPQTRHYYNCYREEDRTFIAKVRPGLSGVGSILFRDEESLLAKIDDPIAFDEQVITPYKGKVEHWYIIQQSIVLYFKLIFTTIIVVLIPNAGFHKYLLEHIPEPPQEHSEFLES